MTCTNRFPLLFHFEWVSGPFWAKKGCFRAGMECKVTGLQEREGNIGCHLQLCNELGRRDKGFVLKTANNGAGWKRRQRINKTARHPAHTQPATT